MKYNNAIKYFKEHYKGWKLSFYLTGGAISISDFLKVPGAGKFIHAIYMPYSEEANQTLILNHCSVPPENFPSVSPNSVYIYDEVLKKLNKDDRIVRVVASCALTTSRYRRGDNKAIISINGEMWQLNLFKYGEKAHSQFDAQQIESIRIIEDQKVAYTILSLISTNASTMKDKALNLTLDASESLERVN